MGYPIKTVCPHCGLDVDVTECFGVDGAPRAPRPGDPSLCLRCLEVSTFHVSRRPGGDWLELRPSTAAESANFAEMREVQSARAAILLFRTLYPEAGRR